MALTPEWRRRIQLWEKALWNACYRPVQPLLLEGFVTTEHLTPQQAARRTFRPMPPGTPWGAKWEYGWFRTSVVLPPETQGKRVVVRLNPGGVEGLVWINGLAAGSLGWGRSEITLTRQATAGQCYDLLLEVYAGHGPLSVGGGPYPYGVESLSGAGPTQCTVGESTVGIWYEEVYQAAVDFTTLFELSQLLDPLSLRASQIDEALMETTLLIDPELPEEEMMETVRSGRERMRPLLEKRNGPTMPTLFAFGHGHIDVAWLWPLRQTERKIAATILNQLHLFEEYPEHRFLQSQPHLYWMLRRCYPEIYARLKEAVKAGKVIADGGMYVEADTNLSGGESLIRQILYGRAFFQSEFGVESRILWLPDTFGFSGALPQILKGCGMIGFATQKLSWAYTGSEPFPYNTFWWEGIDGTAIPAHIFTNYNSEMRPRELMERWNSRLQKNGIQSMIMAFGWGDGGGGPHRDHLEFYRRVRDLEGLPRVRMASPAEFFADLLSHGLPRERYVGELYFAAHRGTYTSQARTKRNNRRSEFALREAEFWGCAARVLRGFEFVATTLQEQWRQLLVNQFHDILPGSSIAQVYEEAEASYAEILSVAQKTAQQAARALVSAGKGWVVFNSLPWARRVLIDTPDGEREVDLPPCGWAAVDESSECGSPAEEALARESEEGFVLENSLLRAVFNRRGELIGVWDKEGGREVLAGHANRFYLYKDVPTDWDAWDIDSMTELLPVETNEPVAMEVLVPRGVAARLRLRRRLHHSLIEQVITLRRWHRRIDFETRVDWQERHKLLKVAFPLNVHTNEAISEIQFGHLRRPTHRSRQHDADCFEVYNHKWTALAEEGRGAAILNDCKYGLSVKGNTINLTLLRAAMAPDKYADRGEHRFTYALYFWNGGLLESGLLQEAYDLNVPPLIVGGAEALHPFSLFILDKPNIVLETLKPAEDGSSDLILRLYEGMRTATRCTLQTTLPVRSVYQTNMLEQEPQPLTFAGGRVALDFRAFEIKTLRLVI
ncbi:MAG: glycoside hydrolase family 38 C-terminal domain-containing protein [Anaerolineales bacterium]|nr:glycosyl hydrolase-related protein [Anaerolineales bacterium]MDW8445990.1 glycoside hydrolase family 38 C-terminal domain-containing protein [Anaerolineales bacterium]